MTLFLKGFTIQEVGELHCSSDVEYNTYLVDLKKNSLSLSLCNHQQRDV